MSHFYGFPIVAYVSLALDDENSSQLNTIKDYCRQAQVETEIYAEDALPEEKYRPFWQKVLDLIERNDVSLVVVPSLKHIAGRDLEGVSSFLTLLKIKGVRLKSLAEGIDSQRDSRKDILGKL